jgi:3-oxoacyl-[acyl-carrier protein] reductase
MKRFLITGSSRGLGLEIARKILSTNESCVIGLSRKLSPEFRELMMNFPGRVEFLEFDLANTEEIETFYRQNIKQLGPLAGLVNNAAVAYDDLASNIKLDALEMMFRVNVYAPMILSKLFIRDSILREINSSIVHISSVSAHTGYKGLSMYAATKGSLEAFSLGVAREWGVKGIRSNAVAAGFMETEMSGNIMNDLKAKIYNRTSLRKPTTVSSVAATVAFLLAPESESITGATIAVDSGTL